MAAMDLANAIIELRRHLGLSQLDLGKKIGTTLITVARNEAGMPVQAGNLGRLHRLALESKRADLAKVFRESLRSVKGITAVKTEAVMAVDFLDYQREIWKDALALLKKTMAKATGDERRAIEQNIPDYRRQVDDLADAIKWHKTRHDKSK